MAIFDSMHVTLRSTMFHYSKYDTHGIIFIDILSPVSFMFMFQAPISYIIHYRKSVHDTHLVPRSSSFVPPIVPLSILLLSELMPESHVS